MDEQDFFKIIGVIVFGMFVIYYVVKFFQLQTSLIEGLEAAPAADPAAKPAPPGAASGAAAYAEAIKALTIKKKDTLLISQYRKDYEDTIVALDDWASMQMLSAIVSVKQGDPNSEAQMYNIMNMLNLLKTGKAALNDVMKFIDKQ